MWGTPADTATPTTSPTATRTATPTLTPSPTTTSESCLIESVHPYANGYDHTWTLHNPDPAATASTIHFGLLETEAGYDYVIIQDSDGHEIQKIDGANPSGLWSDPVPGRFVRVRLTSDGSISAWGFCVDQVRAVAQHSVWLPLVLR